MAHYLEEVSTCWRRNPEPVRQVSCLHREVRYRRVYLRESRGRPVTNRWFPYSTARPEVSVQLPWLWLMAVRITVSAVWIYEGLWLKMIHPAAHELAVMRSVALGPLPPDLLLFGIGCGELLLGLGVLSGFSPRFLMLFQATIL